MGTDIVSMPVFTEGDSSKAGEHPPFAPFSPVESLSVFIRAIRGEPFRAFGSPAYFAFIPGD
jgi:hypothetical protein